MFFVVSPGLEPRLAEPKSDVLPLHHETILMLKKSDAKVRLFIETAKFRVKIYLFRNQQKVILLTFLNQQVFIPQQIRRIDKRVGSC